MKGSRRLAALGLVAVVLLVLIAVSWKEKCDTGDPASRDVGEQAAGGKTFCTVPVRRYLQWMDPVVFLLLTT